MSRIKDRLDRLEVKLQRPEVKHIFLVVVDRPPVSGWESLQTNIRVERLPEETDEELKSRAIAADNEARRNGAGAGFPVSVFTSWGPGWSY
jgi:hypothetical protein